MPARALRTVLTGGAFFESPRWHDGRWWVSDFYRRLVLTLDADGHAREVLTVEGQPSGLGWLPDGALLVVSMKDRRLLRRGDGQVDVHADLSEHASGHLNDMVVDAHGRAYVGNFGFDLMAGERPAPAELLRVDPDGSVTVVADDLRFPNGSVITPDGATLIVGESVGRRLSAFTIIERGMLRERRLWADLSGVVLPDGRSEVGIAPDGCCLDAAGRIWVADATGHGVLLVAPGGTIVEHLAPPDGLGMFACMLGGDDGRTLLLCCAPDFHEERRSRTREAVLLSVRVDVPRAGYP